MRKTTLKDLQNVLPIGVFNQGTFCRDFELRSWRMVEERKIGEVREKGEGLTLGLFVSEILSLMVTKLGGENFEEKPDAERRLMLNQMYFADVLYLYIYLRYQALGNDILFNIICPSCKKKFDFTAYIETLEISVYDDVKTPAGLEKKVELEKGVEIKGETQHSLWLRPTTWNAMEKMEAAITSNDGALKMSLFRDSIIRVSEESDGVPFILTNEMLDTLWKRDIEKIAKQLEAVNAGADLIISGKCPKCGNVFFQSINWGYDSFFAHSSLSEELSS